jgi:general secretion pathway protein A
MYETYYGLKENPFNVTPDPKFIYLGEKHREAFAHLLYGIRENKGFIVLTGEVGTGKTTLIHYLLGQLNGDGTVKTAFLFNPKLSVEDFIKYVFKDLGVKILGQSKGDYIRYFQSYLLNAYGLNVKVVLIVDEAQGLSPELLEEIRLLSNLETSKSKLLQIILIGQPELDKTLYDESFRQIRQRINMRYHLPALSGKETKEYIEQRLRIAGAKKPILTEEAIKEIYRSSGGIPRLINILSDNSLLNGFAQDKKVVDKKSVKEAAKDLKLKRNSQRMWFWGLLWMGIIGAGLLGLYLYRSGNWLRLYKSLFSSLQTTYGILFNGLENVAKLFS